MSQKISPSLQLNISKEKPEYNPSEEENPISIAASRLLALEIGIERRYMKPPFRTPDSLPKPDAESKEADNLKNSNVQKVTAQLQTWREAVSEAKSAAQLSMCVSALFDSVAWEKSIMKVVCLFIHFLFTSATQWKYCV